MRFMSAYQVSMTTCPYSASLETKSKKDWLIDPGNKSFYNEYNLGEEVYYPNVEEQEARSQEMIEVGMQRMEGKRPEEYIREVNKEFQWILGSQRPRFSTCPTNPGLASGARDCGPCEQRRWL